MYFNIKCKGKLLGPTNEFERSLVFETGEFERPKFDCINILLVLLDFSNQGGKKIITATFKSLYTSDSLMHIFANGEDPDELQHNAAFYQGLHCLIRQKGS